MDEVELFCGDASVLINILGSGFPVEILESAGASFVATPQVFEEVKKCPWEGEGQPTPLWHLREGGFLQEVQLDEKTLELFIELTGAAPPDDLDDGEASTIAYGVIQNGVVVIDERKGRRICRERFPTLRTLCSMDLFAYYFERHKNNAAKCRLALRNALSQARMHIPHDYKGLVDKILKGDALAYADLKLRGFPQRRTKRSQLQRFP